MKHGDTSANRMYIWGHNLLNKLPGVSRKRRKREASKIRRADLKERDRDAAIVRARGKTDRSD